MKIFISEIFGKSGELLQFVVTGHNIYDSLPHKLIKLQTNFCCRIQYSSLQIEVRVIMHCGLYPSSVVECQV